MELLNKLRTLKQDDPYPMHMPGHKRVRMNFPDVYDIDITEIEGFDNLHHPEGVIKQLSEETARLYGADEAYLSVGGTTDMILTSIFAATKPGDKILMARNCHKSVYNAAILKNLKTRYVYPEINKLGIPLDIKAGQVEKALKEDKEIRACVITSPTYEGVISDITAIADACHKKGIPLIVDAAHGAHLGFGSFPPNPISQGADAVTVSLHKTLPSLTQTACLLRNHDSLIEESRIHKYFDCIETSSPSYVLMAGIDNCVDFLNREGKDRFDRYWRNLGDLRKKISALRGIELFEPEESAYDPSKLVISLNGKSGNELARILRRGKIEPEMTSLYYIIAMTSVMDTDQGFNRLYETLEGSVDESAKESTTSVAGLYDFLPEKKEEIGEAENRDTVYRSIEEIEGCVSAATVTVYPPGIPLIVPGEVFTKKVTDAIRLAEAGSLTVDGDYDGKYAAIE